MWKETKFKEMLRNPYIYQDSYSDFIIYVTKISISKKVLEFFKLRLEPLEVRQHKVDN